jgi:hypothetical protein
VRKLDQPRARKARSGPAIDDQRRRGRPPKRQEQSDAEIASLETLTSGES